MKKGVIKNLVAIIIIVALLLLIIVIFFGKSGYFGDIKAEIAKMVGKPIPETDPTIWERDFHRNQDYALKEFNGMMLAYSTAAESEKEVCIAEFPVFSESFFDFHFKIDMRSENQGMSVMLVQWVQDPLDDSKGETVPRSTRAFFQGFYPCVVQGKGNANRFYQDFLVTQADINTPNTKYYGRRVGSIYFDEYEELQSYFGKNQNVRKSVEWNSGTGNRVYYVVKTHDLLCLIPTYGDSTVSLSDGCSAPKEFEDDGEVIDDDCFDYGDSDSLPTLIENGKIKSEFIC